MTPRVLAQYRQVWLLIATFLVAVSGLIYELIAATLSSYLLGDSVRQFSFVIGIFLTAMGVGAWMSRFVKHAVPGFVWAQLMLGIVGGFLAPFVYFHYAFIGSVSGPLYGGLILIGILSGMEIPLIARILRGLGEDKFHFENVLSLDYIGALVASVSFPLLVIPHLGLVSAGLVFGALNLGVAGLSLWIFKKDCSIIQWTIWTFAATATAMALFFSETIVQTADAQLYEDDIILSETTAYQQITITKFRDRVRLFLNHSIQFDSLDEYRYHEMLVHPAVGLAPHAKSVLILGGGDGMAVREVLRHQNVTSVTLVDLDERVTTLFRDHSELAVLNDFALRDDKLTIVNQDAWQFALQSNATYDVIILDLPDPKTTALSKLYSKEFYAALVERLSANGILVTQAGSPVFARKAFWSIQQTLSETRNPMSPGGVLFTLPYHAYVPSFGDWGFVMASMRPWSDSSPNLPHDVKFIDPDIWFAAQVFATDSSALDVKANTLSSHVLVQYYLEGWDNWFR